MGRHQGEHQEVLHPQGSPEGKAAQRELSNLQTELQQLLLLQSRGVDVRNELQEVKGRQAWHFAANSSKIILRSRVQTVEQDETCSRFFFQKLGGGAL